VLFVQLPEVNVKRPSVIGFSAPVGKLMVGTVPVFIVLREKRDEQLGG